MGKIINTKVFVGVVLELGNHKFIAPLTSYKPAQEKINSSSCSAFKLHERTNAENKLGLIALNYMIPVQDSDLIELDIDAQDEMYKKMLYLQYEFIKSNRSEILTRATKLYEHIVNKRTDFLCVSLVIYLNLLMNIKNSQKFNKFKTSMNFMIF